MNRPTLITEFPQEQVKESRQEYAEINPEHIHHGCLEVCNESATSGLLRAHDDGSKKLDVDPDFRYSITHTWLPKLIGENKVVDRLLKSNTSSFIFSTYHI